MSISLVITAFIFSSKDGRFFLGSTSVAEAMGSVYGVEEKLITAVCGILGTIGIIAYNLKYC